MQVTWVVCVNFVSFATHKRESQSIEHWNFVVSTVEIRFQLTLQLIFSVAQIIKACVNLLTIFTHFWSFLARKLTNVPIALFFFNDLSLIASTPFQTLFSGFCQTHQISFAFEWCEIEKRNRKQTTKNRSAKATENERNKASECWWRVRATVSIYVSHILRYRFRNAFSFDENANRRNKQLFKWLYLASIDVSQLSFQPVVLHVPESLVSRLFATG